MPIPASNKSKGALSLAPSVPITSSWSHQSLSTVLPSFSKKRRISFVILPQTKPGNNRYPNPCNLFCANCSVVADESVNLFPHACVHSHLPLAKSSCSMAYFRDVSVGTQKSSPFKRRHLITGTVAAFEANLEKNRYVGYCCCGGQFCLQMHPHLDMRAWWCFRHVLT